MVKTLFLFLYQKALVRFLIFGGLGFLSNIGLFLMLRQMINIIAANLLAYFTAVTLTWLLNRLLTFHSDDAKRTSEWLRYTIVYVFTGGIQVLIFSTLIHESHLLYLNPIFAIMAAASVVAFINFFLSKNFAFRHHNPTFSVNSSK